MLWCDSSFLSFSSCTSGLCIIVWYEEIQDFYSSSNLACPGPNSCQSHVFLHLLTVLIWVLVSLGVCRIGGHLKSSFPNGTSIWIEVRQTPSVTESSPSSSLAQKGGIHRVKEWYKTVTQIVSIGIELMPSWMYNTVTLPSSVVRFGRMPDGNLAGDPLALIFLQPPQVWD